MQQGDAAVLDRPVSEVMTRNPMTIGAENLAAEAYRMLRDFRKDQVPVVNGNHEPVGILDVQDWLDLERGAEPPKAPCA
jgi:arabinose-5-phosphate isomerase